jgi:hypothetical protein
MLVVRKPVYGKQLNGSDAQALDIIDGSLMPKPSNVPRSSGEAPD